MTQYKEYFEQYPQPMFEALCKLSPADEMNSTTPNYGPLLYTLGKAIGAVNVLEIGLARGWTGGFMAWAVKENNMRQGTQGKYYGIDVAEPAFFRERAEKLELPVELVLHAEGSVDYLKKNRDRWPNEFFDLIYIDGWHNTDYVRQEVDLLYPKLKSGGHGYMAHHDIYSYCEKIWKEIKYDPKYQWEHISFFNNYGFGLLRKMEGYDFNKVYWPTGDQPHAENFKGKE